MFRTRLLQLHRDERGTISVVTIFAVMLLAMLLGMVMNVGAQIDGKIRLQNAADSVAQSGTVVLTRGMNSLAYTNHLMCEVFALTAFLREARDRNAEPYVPSILAAWNRAGLMFSGSGFEKFDDLGPAIIEKTPLEQELVATFSNWAAAVSEQSLPIMEMILQEELIPKYQRAVVEAFPEIAQTAAMEAANHNGWRAHGRGELRGMLWRTSVQPVGGSAEATDPSLPVVDPVWGTMPNQATYLRNARQQRKDLAHHYLSDWNEEALYVFDHYAKMSQFNGLWRGFTCGYLEQLLNEEYPLANLPFQIRTERDDVLNPTEHLDQEFSFVGVAYWGQFPEIMPRLYRNPSENTGIAYAEARMFVPHRRLVWLWHHPWSQRSPIGGLPGELPTLPGEEDFTPEPIGEGYYYIGRQPVPDAWNLLSQHWTCQLVPATTPTLPQILQTYPPAPGFEGNVVQLPDLGTMTTADIQLISPH